MVKPLFSWLRITLVAAAALLVTPSFNVTMAQCGLGGFNQGGNLTPNNSWQTVPGGVGSDTYVDFNVTAGNIYSFRYTGAAPSGYGLDMTLSSSSAIIPYNNSLSPINDSWTGGVVCPATPNHATSAEWFATFSGTLRVNTHLWNGAGCQEFVAGATSSILEYKTCSVTGNPPTANNIWIVDAFATTDVSIPNLNARYGYYTATGINFNTASQWPAAGSPSDAPGWVGCGEVPDDNFVIRARRTGFPCGYYNITVNNADDDIRVFVNGNQIFSAGCCITSPVVAASYVLGPNDNIEIRQSALCSVEGSSVSFVPQTVSAISGGTIGGVADGTNICQGPFNLNFTNVASASGGVAGLTNGGSITYDWELSTDGGSTYTSIGVPTANWNLSQNLPAGAVFIVRRSATDACGNTAYSNSITINGRPAPNGTITPTTQTICPGQTAVLTFNFNPGSSPFDVVYTDGVSNYTKNGVYPGDTIMVAPLANTVYSYFSITDSFGCSRTSGFNGAASVTVQSTVVINSVTPVATSCFGGVNGSITINATGGSTLEYSIDGGNTYQPSNVFSGLSPGPYNVFVRDAFGCFQAYPNNPVIVSQPTLLSHTTSSTDASCSNVFDGTITVTATGGTTPYSYSLNNGVTQPGNVFTGLGANAFVVTTFDANGCSFASNDTVANTYIIGVDTTSKTDVSCFGANNGSVTVQVIGGIPPYAYSINGVSFQPSGTFTGLAAGSYTITGRDSKGCTDFVTVTISQPAQLVVSIDSIQNLACAGSASGSIFTTVTGGTAPYTYNWSNGGNTDDITGIASGTYNVTVTDANGCTGTNGATISQPSALSLNIAGYSNLLCVADSTGYIDVTANGGVAPYTYSWSNGAQTEDIYNLLAGTYTVTVIDVNGCQQTISQLVSQPVALVSSVTGTPVTCYGQANGTADLTVSGGTSPYFFQWSTFQATEDVTGLGGGLFYVIITDNNGCQQRDSVLIAEPQALALSANVTIISCFNANDGAIDLTVTGGNGSNTFAWNNGANTEDLSNLNGGTYCVTVTDGQGCSATSCWNISNPSVVSSNFIVKDALCFADSNGVVDLIPSGGTPPYTFNWNNNTYTTEDLLGVPAGNYYVTITDSKGCARVDSANVGEPNPIVTSGFITNVSCNGNNDGVIDITAYGGTLPYSYTWSTGESTEDIIGLDGGNYYVTVTDANNCSAATLYPVIEPPVLSVNAVGTNVTCFGANTGGVAAVPTGGRTPYQYLWNNFSLDSAQNGLPAGTYTVLITDSTGCQANDDVTITQPLEIIVTGVVTDVACNGGATGAVNITVAGGVTPYTFNWSNAATTEDIAGVVAGVYTVTVIDGSSCQKTASFTVGQAVTLFTNISISNPLCYGASNGFITVEVTGGTIPYTYNWNTTPAQTGATATNLEAGTYTLTVTDGGNCSATVSASVVEPTQIQITANGTDAKCYNSATGSVTATVSGGKAPYIYTLNGITQPSDTFGDLAPGTYVITVRDANGCEASEVFQINSPSAVSVDLTAPQGVILAGMTTQLLTTTNSSSSIINHFWQPLDSVIFDFSDCTDATNCGNPYVQPFYTTTFTVTVMNADSCTATDTVTIIVENELAGFYPSAFTPNGDGLNDRFTFDILGATDIEISIFSRWGQQVFYNANQTNGVNATDGWDGSIDGNEAPDDTYVYKLKVTYFDGVVREKSGTVSIMR